MGLDKSEVIKVSPSRGVGVNVILSFNGPLNKTWLLFCIDSVYLDLSVNVSQSAY